MSEGDGSSRLPRQAWLPRPDVLRQQSWSWEQSHLSATEAQLHVAFVTMSPRGHDKFRGGSSCQQRRPGGTGCLAGECLAFVPRVSDNKQIRSALLTTSAIHVQSCQHPMQSALFFVMRIRKCKNNALGSGGKNETKMNAFLKLFQN